MVIIFWSCVSGKLLQNFKKKRDVPLIFLLTLFFLVIAGFAILSKYKTYVKDIEVFVKKIKNI